LTLQEYRELKWSLQGSFSKIEKRGPAYTMRAPCPLKPKTSKVFQTGDLHRSLSAVRPGQPNYTIGRQGLDREVDKSPGPFEYSKGNIMDPKPHPVFEKTTGGRFGTERLLHRDKGKLPGPGDHDHNAYFQSGTLKRSPNYTIQGREAWREPLAPPGPGVGEYQYPNAFRTGKASSIQWTAQGKTEPLAQPQGERRLIKPGPPHYHPPGAGARNEHVNKTLAPSFKFGSEPRGLV